MRTLLLSLAILLVATACGPRWYYPHLDWLLPWYVDDYVTLESSQRSEFERLLVRQLDWHCRSELPAYAAFLRKIQRDVDGEGLALSRQQLMAYYATINLYYQNLIQNIGPELAAMFATASDAQIEELFANLEARNQELAARYVDPPPAVILERRYTRMVERLAEWIGDLDTGQRIRVREWSAALGADNGPWIANRRGFQQELRLVLQGRHQDPDFAGRFTALLISPSALQSESYRRRSARRTALAVDLLADIAGTLSERQRRHLRAHLGALADDFDHLACDPGRPRARLPQDRYARREAAQGPGTAARRPLALQIGWAAPIEDQALVGVVARQVMLPQIVLNVGGNDVRL
jgi:hypothetical protein